MDQPYIVIEHVITETLEQILYTFSEMYDERFNPNGISMNRHTGNASSFLLTFDKPVDFDLFSFLINYLRYPYDIKGYDPTVYGFYKVADIKKTHVTGEWVMVYVAKNDKAYYNVSFTTDCGAHFINDFGSGIKRLKISGEPYNFINVDINNYDHIITVVSQKHLNTNKLHPEAKPWWKFW